MRSFALALCALVGCTSSMSGTTSDPPAEEQPPAECGPTSTCGVADPSLAPSCGCGVRDGLCFGQWALSVSLSGAGYCVAAPAPGQLSARIGTTRLTADTMAAIVDGGYLEISVRAGDQVLVLVASTQLGPQDCHAGYFQPYALDYRSWRNGVPESCTFTLTALGAVGQPIEGTFSATLYDWASPDPNAPDTLDVRNGTFSIERGPY